LLHSIRCSSSSSIPFLYRFTEIVSMTDMEVVSNIWQTKFGERGKIDLGLRDNQTSFLFC
jgi:hypothetical protein